MSIGKTKNYSVLVIGSTLFQPQKQRDRSPTCFDKKWFSAKMWRKKYILASYEVKYWFCSEYYIFVNSHKNVTHIRHHLSTLCVQARKKRPESEKIKTVFHQFLWLFPSNICFHGNNTIIRKMAPLLPRKIGGKWFYWN